ncbi:MAG: replicative DNA helicase [Dysgonamonadaceae bacterium]|jgi:replicative DNA helicase|nr:replicative DNA helicase [Dysgonamonadaceae bacterium]
MKTFVNDDVIPYAREAEEAIISTLLFNGNHIEWLSGILTAEMFHRKSNALVYEAVKSLYDDGKPVDAITVTERLEKTGKLSDAGGKEHLRSMADKIVSTSSLEEYAMCVQDDYIARRYTEIGRDMIKAGMDESTDVLADLAETEEKLAALVDTMAGKSGVISLNDMLRSSYDRLYERRENYRNNTASGVDTGLYWLNRITGGWRRGNLIVLAGRPAMGKTAIALHFAKAAAKKGSRVLVFSMEMSTDELVDRLVISNTDIDSERFRTGNVEDSEMAQVDSSTNILYDLPVSVSESTSVTAAHVRARVREQCRKGCDLVIVDYLNLMIPEGKKNRNRENDISEMTRALKLIAIESHVPVIVLTQLNRECEKRQSRTPELSDLRESGSIEQDADIVLLCFRPAYYWKENDIDMPPEYRDKRNYGELIIAKNRHGRTGFVPFAHNDTISAIYDWNDESLPKNPF